MAAPAPAPTPRTPQSTTMPAETPPRLSQQDLSFTLPPPAVDERSFSMKLEIPSSSAKKRSYVPLSPPSPAVPLPESASSTASSRGRKRRASTTEKPTVSLPPPPTRSRKIIQMRPQTSTTTTATSAPPPSKKAKKSPTGKDQQPTTSASRKVARKTAHSLIERRRRLKMNEEFSVLKGLVPACTGAEMHKLAILQASIEYVRYLEGCVEELKKKTSEPTTSLPPPPAACQQKDEDEADEDEDEEGEEDDNKEQRSTSSSPKSDAVTSPSTFQPTPSASILPPQSAPTTLRIRLPSISPLMFPMRTPVEDTEATHALLLLADGESGRRMSCSSGGTSPRGLLPMPATENGERKRMSVRDLLSS